MKAKAVTKQPLETVPPDRRSLVRVEIVDEDKYPVHVHSVKTGALLGSFPKQDDADFYIDNVPLERLTA